MDKIQFDIKFRPQIESGEYKVETRDGRPARIICWDFNNVDYKIVAVIQAKCGDETIKTYTNEGLYVTGKRHECDLILITPEPGLSEFEEATFKAFEKMCAGDKHLTPRTNHIQEAAAELLALARKELEKDLPKWKKCAPCDEDKATIPAWIVRFDAELAGESAVVHNGHYILFGDLEKLPKEVL